jgi:hypothetical protein
MFSAVHPITDIAKILRMSALRQKPSLKTTRLFAVLYRMVAIWRATVDEDGHYWFAVAL